MGSFGAQESKSSAVNTLQNSINFNPIISVGDDNETDQASELTARADATSTMKDEFGLSAGVAVGDGASARGGAISRGGDNQPMDSWDTMLSDGGSNLPLYIGLGVTALGGAAYFITKKKS